MCVPSVRARRTRGVATSGLSGHSALDLSAEAPTSRSTLFPYYHDQTTSVFFIRRLLAIVGANIIYTDKQETKETPG